MDTDLHEILICFCKKVERVRTEKEDLIDKSRVPINKEFICFFYISPVSP